MLLEWQEMVNLNGSSDVVVLYNGLAGLEWYIVSLIISILFNKSRFWNGGTVNCK